MFQAPQTLAGRAGACLVALLLGATAAGAQQVDPAPSPRSAQPLVTAPLEDRIAAARSVKVITSILNIELGSELDEAHEKLDKLCAPGTHPKEEGGDEGEGGPDPKPASGKESSGDERKSGEHKALPGEEQEEGHKVLWQLAKTDFSAVYVTADDKERIDSITGFLRPDKQRPFAAIGDVAKAPMKDDTAVIWDVLRVGRPLFRVVAKGAAGKAESIRIFVVRRNTGKVVLYHGASGGKSR